MSWEAFWSFATVVASAGVLSALISGGFTWWIGWRERRAKARYLALRTSHSLEQYAGSLLQALYDDANYESSSGQVGAILTRLPSMPDYTGDQAVGPALDLRLVDRVLLVPLMVADANRTLTAISAVVGDIGCRDFARRAAAKAAHLAAILSRDLRYRYDFSPSDGNAGLIASCLEVLKKYPFPGATQT